MDLDRRVCTENDCDEVFRSTFISNDIVGVCKLI